MSLRNAQTEYDYTNPMQEVTLVMWYLFLAVPGSVYQSHRTSGRPLQRSSREYAALQKMVSTHAMLCVSILIQCVTGSCVVAHSM